MIKAKASQKKAPLSHAVGRRKKAVARVWLRRGSGTVTINGKVLNDYFDNDITRAAAITPLRVVPVGANYDVDATVCGGGKNGQADAIKLGISRAMLELDETLRPIFRKIGSLITVDSRQKERKKYGQKGARRKFQFVKR